MGSPHTNTRTHAHAHTHTRTHAHTHTRKHAHTHTRTWLFRCWRVAHAQRPWHRRARQVDDGVRSRGHRLCIFNEHYTVAAARVGAHKTFGTMAVIEFAAVFEGDAAKVAAREAAGAPKPSADAKARQETQWKGKIGLCVSCKQDIKGGSVMEVKGLGKFHKACFACVECAKGLVGVPWKAEKGRTFCADCHAQNFAPRCEACGEPITGSGVKVNGVPYHKEHKPTADGAAAAAPNATKGGGGGATAAVAKPKGKGKAAAAKPSFAGAKTDVGGLAADYGAF
jgi:hypothetical protein